MTARASEQQTDDQQRLNQDNRDGRDNVLAIELPKRWLSKIDHATRRQFGFIDIPFLELSRIKSDRVRSRRRRNITWFRSRHQSQSNLRGLLTERFEIKQASADHTGAHVSLRDSEDWSICR